MAYGTAQARDAVRRVIQDGMTQAAATNHAFSIVRLEDLTDQVAAQATPTGKTFQVRFSQVPTEEYVTVYAIPGTLVAFIDGSTTPAAPTTDVDQNGTFVVATAPVNSLQVTYAWQYFADDDIDDFLDRARSWLREYSSIAQVPDGLNPALIEYAAGEAVRALARKVSLADASAGDAKINLSQLTQEYQTQAKQLHAAAQSDRDSYWHRASETLAPAVATLGLGFGNYQPRR